MDNVFKNDYKHVLNKTFSHGKMFFTLYDVWEKNVFEWFKTQRDLVM